MNSRYAQTMRSNIYGGVIRADLHRIGTDDNWYLTPGTLRLAISKEEQLKRQKALADAIVAFIASPTGAKVAGWAPHVFLTEGAILLSSCRTAPFVSPIRVDLRDTNAPVASNESYREEMKKLNNTVDTWAWTFNDVNELIDAAKKLSETLGPKTDGEKQ